MSGYRCQPRQDLAATESVQGAVDSFHEQPIPCAQAAGCLNSTQHGHAVNTFMVLNDQETNSTPSHVCEMQASLPVEPPKDVVFDSETTTDCAILPQLHASRVSDATSVDSSVNSPLC